jgi:Big-like domain-containing protein
MKGIKLHQDTVIPNLFAGFRSSLLALLAAAAVAGCGGGGGTAPCGDCTSSTSTTTTTPVASSMQLLTSSPTIPTAPGATVTLTSIVLDNNNNLLSGQPVTFTLTDPVSNPAFISNVASTTTTGTCTPVAPATTCTPPTSGTPEITATITLGANKSNRTITVTASVIPTAGATPITASVNIQVTGTVINISGQNSLVFGASLPLTATLQDSGGNPIAGQTLTITSSNGNQITPSSATTSQSGSISFIVTGTAGGADVITVSGAGATGTSNITVNSSHFVFTAPTTNAFVPINTPQVVTLHWDNAGQNQVGQPVLFSSTRGSLSAATVNTDINGNASTSITSAGTGQSTITAAGPGGTPAASLNVVFNTATANKVSVQATQASIPINTFVNGVAQTTSRTALIAVVRDVNNNLVQGATVNFQIVTDPSGGQLDSPAAVTNISGSASVNYIAGTTSSGNNTVQISATVVSVNGVPISGLVQAFVSLSVTGQALFIRMSTDNLVQTGNGIYTKSYYAQVTDAGGNFVTNTTVVFSLRPANVMSLNPPTAPAVSVGGVGITQCEPASSPCPGAYEKGQWVSCAGAGSLGGLCPSTGWFKIPALVNYYDCLNEDTNFNGILDPGEDYNGNGKLDPGNVAGVNDTSVTDMNGIATANVTYVKGFATWSAVNLTATITVAGTEFIQVIPFVLPILESDTLVANVPPPGQVSPFGTGVCNSPN